MILIISSGEFSCIYIFFSVFSVFNFVSFYLTLPLFGRVVFFLVWCFGLFLLQGSVPVG